MQETAPIDTVDDLLDIVQGWGPVATRYVKLLRRCAEEGYPVGMREETQDEHAVSDWEAAALIPENDEDVTVKRITKIRRALNREVELVVEHGHRAGKATYTLNSALIE